MSSDQITPNALPARPLAQASTDQASSGIPILVGADGVGQALSRVPLSPKGQGEFDEAWLQRLIHDNPICLPIQEIEPGLDYFSALFRELQTPHGYVDNLLMTGRGDIAIVETKLFRNPEARRAVLAQVLDYAACLFAMTYAEFERAVLASTFAPALKPPSLYEAIPGGDKLPEAAFIDAVQRNLRLGRALLLVAGDGIRNDAERLLGDLQIYARFGFTLALVELAVFRMPAGGYLVRPRTLAKTAITQRTIVEVSGGGIVSAREERPAVPQSLTADAFWEALESQPGLQGARSARERMIAIAEPLGIYPDLVSALSFKAIRSGNKRPINLGYFDKRGVLSIDTQSSTPVALRQKYATELADHFSAEVRLIGVKSVPAIYKDNVFIRLPAMLNKLDGWPSIMKRYIDAVAAYDADTET